MNNYLKLSIVNIIIFIFLLFILFSINGCATDPGPHTVFMGGMSEIEVMEQLDGSITIEEFNKYPKISLMEGCNRPLNLIKMYEANTLFLHKANYYNTSKKCLEIFGVENAFLREIMTLTGNTAFGCTNFEFYDYCRPKRIDVYYIPDANNGTLKHELQHAQGFADEFYGEFKN